MTARKNIMRRFRIDEISGVDSPCNEHARSVIFKRAAPRPEPGLESLQASSADHWSAKREAALQALQAGAERLAKAEAMSGPAAYDAYLSSPEGAELYQRAS